MIVKQMAAAVALLSLAAAYNCHQKTAIPDAPKQAIEPSKIVRFMDSMQHKAESLSIELSEATSRNKATFQPIHYSAVGLGDPVRILPTADKVNQGSPGEKTASLLFDGDVKTAWFTGWQNANYPMSCGIELGDTFTLTGIRIFDGTGQPTLRVTDQNNDLILYLPLTLYNQWHNITFGGIENVTRLNFLVSGPEGDKVITEVEIYGYKKGAPDVVHPPTDTVPTKDTLPDLPKKNDSPFEFGVNGFHWVPLDAVTDFTQWRHFAQWQWFEAEQGKYRFQPTAQANGNYDDHFSDISKMGCDAILCVNQSPEFIRNTYPEPDMDVRPCYAKDDPANPLSYADFARFWFQVAARYGRTKVADDLLSVDDKPRWTNDPVNVKKTALGTLKYCEIWNEPDKWWKGSGPANMTPEQYAALLSACYDGHEGAIKNAGVKQADKTMQVVMAGLTKFDSAYIERMGIWFKTNRKDKRFACDVMNFHHYCNADGGIFYGREFGIAPEIDNVADKMRQIKSVCQRINPGAKLWWSEFGYDTDASGPHQAKGYGSFTPEQVQGVWIVRSYLEAIEAGFDAAHIYNAIDEPNPAGGLFQSSGILTGQNGSPKFVAKGGYEIVAKFASELRGATLLHSGKKAGIRFMLFHVGAKIKAVVWLPCDAGCAGNMTIAGKLIPVTEVPQILEIF